MELIRYQSVYLNSWRAGRVKMKTDLAAGATWPKLRGNVNNFLSLFWASLMKKGENNLYWFSILSQINCFLLPRPFCWSKIKMFTINSYFDVLISKSEAKLLNLASQFSWWIKCNSTRTQACTLTKATKCSRFMPGLFALVSAKDRRDDNLKPTAFPA